jgi:hypothetical protein
MSVFVKSDPRFFRLVVRAMGLGVIALLVATALVPAPLEVAANPAHAPNPAKSAWFLLWIQELVSHSSLTIYGVLAVGAAAVALPWLPLHPPERARWFPRRLWPVTIATLALFALILALTVVGLFFRGPDWRVVSPF